MHKAGIGESPPIRLAPDRPFRWRLGLLVEDGTIPSPKGPGLPTCPSRLGTGFQSAQAAPEQNTSQVYRVCSPRQQTRSSGPRAASQKREAVAEQNTRPSAAAQGGQSISDRLPSGEWELYLRWARARVPPFPRSSSADVSLAPAPREALGSVPQGPTA